jgi:phosphoglycolate phosphatase-like HAD superfamily hydrolase
MDDGTVLFPGAERLLEQLTKSGRRLGVCSNKLASFTGELLRRLGVADHFGAVLGPEMVALPKPAPDMLLEAARRLGGTPEDTLYVGDMSIDVLAGRKARMTVWVVATGSETVEQLRAAKPDRIFDGLTEMSNVLLAGRASDETRMKAKG